jgi:hypothetical protein
MSEFVSVEIKKHIGTIRKSEIGWTKEFNLVSWNGKEPKYDIREWNERHDRMSRGSTFTREEAQKLLLTLIDSDLLDTSVIIKRAMKRG